MLSGRGLCDELITRPEESYRPCCVVVCELETSRMGAPYIYMTLGASGLTLRGEREHRNHRTGFRVGATTGLEYVNTKRGSAAAGNLNLHSPVVQHVSQ